MNLQTVRSNNSPAGGRSVVAILLALGISMAARVASGQEVIPFGDVPAIADFPEADIAARGHQNLPKLIYSAWRKLCFRDVQGEDRKMVCYTSIEGKSDLGELFLRSTSLSAKMAPRHDCESLFLQETFCSRASGSA